MPEDDKFQNYIRGVRLDVIRDIMTLMEKSALPYDKWDHDDTIRPYSNGYSMWFIGTENYAPDWQLMSTAPLEAEEILDLIDKHKEDQHPYSS